MSAVRTIATFTGILAISFLIFTILYLIFELLELLTLGLASVRSSTDLEEGLPEGRSARFREWITRPFRNMPLGSPSIFQQNYSPKIRWATLFPSFAKGTRITKQVEFVAVGNKPGELLLNLSPRYPNTLMAVMETRPNAVQHFNSRIETLRKQSAVPGSQSPLNPYQNVSAILAASLKSLPTYFFRNQLDKIFICFPDKEVIKGISPEDFDMAEVYAQIVQPGGMLYFVTDNEKDAMLLGQKFAQNDEENASLWEEVSEEVWRTDGLVTTMIEETGRNEQPEMRRIGVWKRQEIYS